MGPLLDSQPKGGEWAGVVDDRSINQKPAGILAQDYSTMF